eukprot:jgi/Mesvir1/23332/Mv21028-RA.1
MQDRHITYTMPYRVLRAAPLLALLDKSGHPTWPERTDVCCWHCCHPFDNVPATLPVKYKEGRGFLVKGIFCSFACAKAHNLESACSLKEVRNTWLFHMTFKLWKANPAVAKGSFPGIRAAPPRTFLKMFGGDMTIEEFRNPDPVELHRLLDPPFTMEVIQQVHCVYAINERERSMKKNSVSREPTVREGGDRSAKKDAEPQRLSLKRSRASSDPKNSLDKFLGIKRTASRAPTVPIASVKK